MHQRIIYFFVALFLTTLLPGLLSAQTAWTKPKGEGYFKLSQNIIRATGFFNPEGNVADITTTSVYQTVLYGELGITDKLTAIVNVPFFIRSTINNLESTSNGGIRPGDEFNGFGDLQFGLKWGLIQQGPVIWSISAEVKTPTGNNVGGNTELLQTGDGAWGAFLMTDVSHSFYPTPIYISGGVGFNWRGNATLDYSTGAQDVNYSDGFIWRAEFGYTPGNFLLALKLNHLIALKNGDDIGNSSSSIFGNNISYLSLTPEIGYTIGERFGVSAGVGTVLAAENILAAPNWVVGAYFLLK